MGCSRFARRYSGNRGCFLFLGVLRCFSSPSSRSPGYGFTRRRSRMTGIRLPHSGIPGLTSVCDYPGLIAAYHALHRLLMPRHPPYTLSSLTPISLGARETAVDTDSYSIIKERPGNPGSPGGGHHPAPLLFAQRGGDERNRTADPLLAKQVLSQLSYIPTSHCGLAIAEYGMEIRNPHSEIRIRRSGPSWDRTRDLTLIKRAL